MKDSIGYMGHPCIRCLDVDYCFGYCDKQVKYEEEYYLCDGVWIKKEENK